MTKLCIVCEKELTNWVKFKRLFWGGTANNCELCRVLPNCCSNKCWGIAIDKEIKRCEKL